jgi:hypothetical protein
MTTGQPWHLSHKADQAALPLADRHYNRRKVGSPQFVPPGRALVLIDGSSTALWVTSWPFAEYVRHAWPGAMVNSLFRRESESPDLASDLITAAVAATRAVWTPPPLGMVTFVDRAKTIETRGLCKCGGLDGKGCPWRPLRVIPGLIYIRAGFRHVGTTKGGLAALQLVPDAWPEAVPANPARNPDGQFDLFDLDGVSA